MRETMIINKSILLVEDNRQDEKLVLRALRKVNLANQVDVVRDGQQALDYMFREGEFAGRPGTDLPTVVLLDIGLPRVSGLEVLERLRADARTSLQPVVILTSSDEERDRMRSYENGAISFVRKPLDFAEFAETVSRLGIYGWQSTNRSRSEVIMSETLNILVIEDRNADFLMVERHLKQNGLSVHCSRVDSLEGLKEALDRESWNLVLSDYHVPQLNFQESLNLVQTAFPDLPVIMVTGTVGEEMAVDLLKVGVRDFVLKDNLARLVPAVLRSLKEKRELAERRCAEVQLRESEEWHRTILQTAMDGFWLMDTQGRLLEVNETYCRMSGYSVQELLAMRVPDLEVAETADDTTSRIRQIMAHGEHRFESRHRSKDGSIYDVEVSAQYRPIEGGQVVAFLRDITKRKQAEEKLQKKNAEIEQFIYTVSHDLRSPLVTVKTFIRYLEIDMAGDSQEQIAQDIKFIHGAADKMKMLLDELLEMSRIGRVETPPVCVSLREVLNEVLDDLAGIMTERKVDIHPPDTDLMLFGDRPRLCKIWLNLIENAIKYCRDGSIPRIELGVQQVSGETVFSVKDNGIGVDPQYHIKIFGIFEKVNPKSPGAGLGLSMVQRIVEKCSGRVWVESDGSGQGSCFKFTLPGALYRE